MAIRRATAPLVRGFVAFICLLLCVLGCSSLLDSGEEQAPDRGEKVAQRTQAVVVNPANFTASMIANVARWSTKMALAADGRIFVVEQAGNVWIIKNGSVLSTPFLTVPNVDGTGEHGLYELVFDPNFATNNFVYLFYTTTVGGSHNRISRFTANGDTAAASSELVIFEFPALQTANHLGGAMQFGPDGKLYVTHGENSLGAPAQDMTTTFGKLLRINSDGSIPADNPFFTTTTGNSRAIWALGLRSPFSMGIRRSNGRIFYNDVGDSAWEEVNDVVRGGNYGWPAREGTNGTDPAGVTTTLPIFQYAHSASANPFGCAVTAGTFYDPVNVTWPASYVGKYLFAEYCQGWLGLLDPANNNSVTMFASATTNVVDMEVSNTDGSLYYLEHNGMVWKITYNNAGTAPAIAGQPTGVTTPIGGSATFTVSATGTAPLSYQWQKNQLNIAGATAASYTATNAQLADNGAKYRAIVSNAFGTATSAEATLTVTSNTAPTPTILTPAVNSTYTAGSVISFSGNGTDTQDGTLPASAFTWRIDFHHDTHFHPAMPDTTGIKSGTFTTPNTGEHSANVWFRVYLTVKDSGGLTTTITRDVQPVKSNITLASNPTGLTLTLDDQQVTAPNTVASVVGMQRTLGVVSPQTVGNNTYTFTSWSDGGAVSHAVATPAANTTYTANFSVAPATCDEVAILQNRDGRYVVLNGTALSYTSGTTSLAGAARFLRSGGAATFSLKSKTTGNYVVNNAGTLQATNATPVIIATEACGATPANMGALRIDLNGNGNATDDVNNYWKSNDNVGLTDTCPAANTVAWEKFQVVVTQAGVSCAGNAPVCGNGVKEGTEQCDDGNVTSGDGCSATCTTETPTGTCDEVVILQNRDSRYVGLNGTQLSWVNGPTSQASAARFIRSGSTGAFTLKSVATGNFVVNNAGTLQATGATGATMAAVACGTTPANMGALRIDLNGNGNATDDANNYWKSNDSIGLTDACPATNTLAWEKFQVIVTAANVSCGSTATSCGDVALTRVTATASSVEGGWTATQAIDAQVQPSRWASNYAGLTDAQADAQSITVDLGQNRWVGRVVLNWEAASAKDYALDLSTDSATWWTAKSFTGGAAGARIDTLTSLTAPHAARYVRVRGIDRATAWGYSLYDVGVFGDDNPTCGP